MADPPGLLDPMNAAAAGNEQLIQQIMRVQGVPRGVAEQIVNAPSYGEGEATSGQYPYFYRGWQQERQAGAQGVPRDVPLNAQMWDAWRARQSNYPLSEGETWGTMPAPYGAPQQLVPGVPGMVPGGMVPAGPVPGYVPGSAQPYPPQPPSLWSQMGQLVGGMTSPWVQALLNRFGG